MSYFDGTIPKSCASCFSWNGETWIQTAPGLCDKCDCMLDMFPVLDADREKEREKLRLLAEMDTPECPYGIIRTYRTRNKPYKTEYNCVCQRTRKKNFLALF